MSAPSEAAKARAALDVLARLRLRTAPHTSEARSLNTELRTAFRLKRPTDALRAWKLALGGEPSDEVVRKAVMEWSLAVGLHAAINLADLAATRRLVDGLVETLPLLAPRAGAIFAWSRRGRDVTEALGALVGRSAVMDVLRTQTWRAVFTDDVRKAIALKAPHRLSVLITGEPGTGKEIVARTIAAGRGSLDPEGEEPGPYVAVNIASLAPSLVSSELFGHVRGAYTGALSERKGLFHAAHGGVLFLDEIGDAPPEVQVRLLRALQEGTVRPVGADRATQVEVRVLAATNRALDARGDGAFRRDLLERLSVLRVECPPLREREEDIPELVRHFVAEEIDLGAWPTISDEVLARLLEETRGHTWPGNVRELRACTNRVLAGQPALLRSSRPAASPVRDPGDALLAHWGVLPLERLKHVYADAVLRRTGGNKSEAARQLGIDRNTLSRYLKQAAAWREGQGEEETSSGQSDASAPPWGSHG
ncbi:MAG: sigma-54-dependent Fis family transcriptional regulator [Planctomycetota bacterium]|nr:MAG: sigma-54-dependent Fis family transcriptional regulator [Planctomycetota bacterium]